MKKSSERQKDFLERLPVIIILVSLIALILSMYLFWSTVSGRTHLAGCGGNGADCEAVIGTRWGSWFGIPVSLGGLLIYSSIFSLSIYMRKDASRNQWLALLFFSIVASISALWFTALQVFVLKSYCIYCITIHVCGWTIAFVILWKISFRSIVRQKVATMIAGFAAVAILAAGQIFSSQSSVSQTQSVVTPVASQPSVLPTPVVVAPRDIILAKGKLRFTLTDFPIIGSPDADNVVAHFFDYTCPACREFHSALRNTHRIYENETALIMIPIPLDAVCNPAIKETAYIHQNACDFARIGLALWKTMPSAYEQYDQFLFRQQYPPPIDAARSLADQLAGKEVIDLALADPAIVTVLRSGLQMFYSPAMEQKALPSLASKDEVIVGFPPPGLLPRIFAGR